MSAKDEIARLKAENERLRAALDHNFLGVFDATKQMHRARAEVDRLRLLLQVGEIPSSEMMKQGLQDAFDEAERWLDMADVPGEDEDPEAWNAAFDQRLHCAACTMRGIGSILSPAIDRYVAWALMQPVRSDHPAPQPVDSDTLRGQFTDMVARIVAESLLAVPRQGEPDLATRIMAEWAAAHPDHKIAAVSFYPGDVVELALEYPSLSLYAILPGS